MIPPKITICGLKMFTRSATPTPSQRPIVFIPRATRRSPAAYAPSTLAERRARLEPGRAEHRVLADLGLPAPAPAAPAHHAVGVHHRVADLAAVAVGAAERPSADDDAAADPGLAGEVDQVRRARTGAADVLCQGAEVGLVADQRADPAELGVEQLSQW